MRKLHIQNIKNIKSLEFTLPDKTGVYLLTGSNGCGKTSLLVAMYRLGFQNAFAQNFKSPPNVSYVDDFKNATIAYTANENTVTFRKSEQKWVPTPKNIKNKVFDDFGFKSVIYIKADGERVEPTKKDLEERATTKAKPELISNLNTIFETNKYNKLKQIKIGQGRSREIYLIQKGDNKEYYSEKQFSLGELLVLKVVREILNAQKDSLILIDEAEMALHPRVQKKLLKFLENQATQKELLILLSTHSSTIIKSVKKEQIYLLDNSEKRGIVKVLNPCFPSQALGNIDFASSVLPDLLFLVEDENAEILLDRMLSKLFKEGNQIISPKWNIVPIGGFKEVVKFLIKSDNMIFNQIQVNAFLDKDVYDEHIHGKTSEFVKQYESRRKQIHFLPCTPEQGIIELLESEMYTHSKQFKTFTDLNIDLAEVMESETYTAINNSKVRERAKNRLSCIKIFIETQSGKYSNEILKMLYAYYIEQMPLGDLKKLLYPIINAKK